MKIYLSDEEAAYVKEQPKGWLRNIIIRFRDTENRLTPEELDFLKRHGGTHGVIRLAQQKKAEVPDTDPQTGEVPMKEEK